VRHGLALVIDTRMHASLTLAWPCLSHWHGDACFTVVSDTGMALPQSLTRGCMLHRCHWHWHGLALVIDTGEALEWSSNWSDILNILTFFLDGRYCLLKKPMWNSWPNSCQLIFNTDFWRQAGCWLYNHIFPPGCFFMLGIFIL
jgi:hypothetical protein